MPTITARDNFLSIKDLHTNDLTKIVEYPSIPDQIEFFSLLQSDVRSLSGIERLNLTYAVTFTECLELENLVGLPEELNGHLSLKKTAVKSLRGIPAKLGGNLVISDCAELQELDVLPNHIGGLFNISSRYSLSLSPLKQVKFIGGQAVWLNFRIKGGFLNLFRIQMPNFKQLFTLDSESDVNKKMQALLIEANQNPSHRNRIMLEAQDYLLDSKHEEWGTL